ncbi:MAG TPA: DUF2461 domain-containing protein [Acidimicrobiales bacterium]
MPFTGFGPGAVAFYEELAANNTRAWWQAHRDRYEAEIRAPLEHLLADLADEFGEARVFRPQRDTRFSPDKSPYKTTAAATIEAAYEVGSSLYVQLSAEGLMTGAGLWHPARDQLARLREAIDDPRTGTELEELLAGLRDRGVTIEAHESLRTAPRGYPKDHRRIELLRMKGLTGIVRHPPADWLQTPKARDVVAGGWRSLRPLHEWLGRHVGGSRLPVERRGGRR